jgi:hypothetical protein
VGPEDKKLTPNMSLLAQNQSVMTHLAQKYPTA